MELFRIFPQKIHDWWHVLEGLIVSFFLFFFIYLFVYNITDARPANFWKASKTKRKLTEIFKLWGFKLAQF